MSASDEPRECPKCHASIPAGCVGCPPCGQATLDARERADAEDSDYFGKLYADGVLGSDEPRLVDDIADAGSYYRFREKLNIAITPANAPIIAAVLAEVAQIQGGQGILMARYNTLSEYDKRIRDASAAICAAMRLKAGGAP